jgi:GAF domain-containing protein
VPINYTPPDGTTRTVGVITLVGRRSNVRFSAGDSRLLSAIASQIGAALETQRLVRTACGRSASMRELELAHDLQLKLLPDPARSRRRRRWPRAAFPPIRWAATSTTCSGCPTTASAS